MIIAAKSRSRHGKVLLQTRKPFVMWCPLALLASGAVHGVLWYLTRAIAAQGEIAGGDSVRQIGLSVFWMVCAAAVWQIKSPRKRLHAVGQVLIAALLIGLLGSVMAFINLTLTQNFELSLNNALIFAVVALPMVVSQLIVALPSAVLFQQILLKRPALVGPDAETTPS